MTGLYSFDSDPFAAREADVTAQILAALMPDEDQSRPISPLAPGGLRSMKDQSRMPLGRRATLPLPESVHFKTPLPAASMPASQSALPLPASSAPVDDEDPFADLMPGAQAKTAADADDPFADLLPGAQPKRADTATATGPKASPLYDVFRSAGTGLRSGVEGIIGLPGDVEQLGGYGMRYLADQATQAMGGEARPDYVSGSGNALDIGSGAVNRATSKVVGPSYKPETTAGKYARTAGEFLPGSLAGPGSLARKAITFGLMPAAASETAGQATEGTAAEPWARVIGGLGGGLTASALFAPRIAPTAAQTARQEIADAARRQRVHLPEAAMPDNPTQTWVAGKLGQVPFLGRPLQASAERTAETMGRRAEQIAAQTGDPDYASAAHRSRDALNDWQTDASKTLLEQRYTRVDARITDPDRTTPLSSTRAVLRDILDEQDLSTSTASNSAMDLVREAANRRGGLTYEGLKQLRTDIGARMSGKITPEPGTSQPALKRLYGALTDDLEAAVSNSGGAPALRAWQQANAAAAEVALIRENVAKIVGVKGDASPHAVLNRITQLAGTTNSANIERLGRVMEAIWRTDPDALDDIGAAIIGRLGRDPTQPAEFFSPERYLTSYAKLSPEGRQAIFGPATTRHLDDLARVSQRHRELMRKGNPSGTGGVVVGTGLLTGLFHAPISTVSTIVTGYGLARILARPAKAEKLVNWARARNGVLSSATTNATQTYLTATRELADTLAAENGQDPTAIAAKLAK